MYIRGYLQGSENGRVGTIGYLSCNSNFSCICPVDASVGPNIRACADTVVKELWLRMCRQHPGCYKAVLFKEDTDDYRKLLWIYCIYNILNHDALCIIVIFVINWNIATCICCIYEWMKCYQKFKIIDVWIILLGNIILLRKSQLVTSYRLKIDVNRHYWIPALSNC